MNYIKVYNSIVERAKFEERNQGETHHIIPKCMGGGDNKENLVKLSFKEHFLVHRLLCIIYPDNPLLKFAFWSMCNQNKTGLRTTPSQRVYNTARELYRKALKEFWEKEENKEARSRQVKETWKSTVRRENHIIYHTGKQRSETGKQNMKKPHRKHLFRSQEHKEKLSFLTSNRVRIHCSSCEKKIQYCYYDKHIKTCKNGKHSK